MTWYHGGSQIHDWRALRWDRDRATASGNAEGPGMYWTTDRDEAERYVQPDDPVIYAAQMRPGFKLAPARPTLPLLLGLYAAASEDAQAVFLSNWGHEWPAPVAVVRQVLTPYTRQATFMDAAITLFHDLFRYDADAYVRALVGLGFDGFIVEKGTTGGSARRQHLIVWNPFELAITHVGE